MRRTDENADQHEERNVKNAERLKNPRFIAALNEHDPDLRMTEG